MDSEVVGGKNGMKVHMIASSNGLDLQRAINDFIKDKFVIDIKFQSTVIESIRTINDRVLIMYEEKIGASIDEFYTIGNHAEENDK